METLFEIDVRPEEGGSRQSARHLHQRLSAAILDGRLARGARLPPTREAQAVFGVSRNTLAEVYERLLNDGFIVTRSGSGTFVAPLLPPAAGPPGRRGDSPAPYRLNPFWQRDDVLNDMNFWREPGAASAPPRASDVIDLRPGLPDFRAFPHDVFRRVISQQLRRQERKAPRLISPQGSQGSYPLRRAISRHIALTRAVVCREEDVLVTCGAQQAFDLLARTLVTPGETTVAIEDPGYPPLRVAFRAAGARLVPVGVDHEGLIVEKLPEDVRVVCVCPSHQFPLGVTMSARRRAALIEFARTHEAVIIEDDYDGEFRYEANPLTALRTQAAGDVVFYVGTFSKCMLPALRLGFVVAPEWAMRTLVTAKNCADWHCPMPLQAGVAAFINEGHLTRHVRRMRGLYRQRRELILDVLGERLSAWLAPIPSSYGMHITVKAVAPVDCDRLAEVLQVRGVTLHSLSRYYLGPQTTAGLVLSYGCVAPAGLNRGLSTLCSVLRHWPDSA